MEVLLYVLIILVAYTYIGYAGLIYLLNRIKSIFVHRKPFKGSFTPKVSLLVAAYNEEDILEEKIDNLFKIDYPRELMEIVFVTDGSDDRSVDILNIYPGVKCYHQNERKGKTAALNRVIPLLENEIVILSDANAMLNRRVVKNMVRHFQNPKVACVAGEKRVLSNDSQGAQSSGEGFYWKYESWLKKQDYDFHSAMGAAGELFAIKKSDFTAVSNDVILDDFIMSMKVLKKGSIIAYEPYAYATEYSSASLEDEMKRKVRISAGGIQSIQKVKELLNVVKYPFVSFQLVSHRLLRWTLAPLCILILFPLNVYLTAVSPSIVADILMLFQLVFYVFACKGFINRNQKQSKLFYVPFYFLFMNYCMIKGVIRFFKGKQSSIWEKVERSLV